LKVESGKKTKEKFYTEGRGDTEDAEKRAR